MVRESKRAPDKEPFTGKPIVAISAFRHIVTNKVHYDALIPVEEGNGTQKHF